MPVQDAGGPSHPNRRLFRRHACVRQVAAVKKHSRTGYKRGSDEFLAAKVAQDLPLLLDAQLVESFYKQWSIRRAVAEKAHSHIRVEHREARLLGQVYSIPIHPSAPKHGHGFMVGSPLPTLTPSNPALNAMQSSTGHLPRRCK